MNKYFAIRKDAPKYKQLDLSILDVTRHAPDDIDTDRIYQFSERNTAMLSWWSTPDTKFIDYGGEPSSIMPDLSCWIDATLVLSPKANRLIGEILAKFGELLPVTIASEIYYIFNCFTKGEADEQGSKIEYSNGIEVDLEHLEFKDSASKHLIFKSDFEKCRTLFCGVQFKEVVELFDLKGLIFDENLVPIYDID